MKRYIHRLAQGLRVRACSIADVAAGDAVAWGGERAGAGGRGAVGEEVTAGPVDDGLRELDAPDSPCPLVCLPGNY